MKKDVGPEHVVAINPALEKSSFGIGRALSLFPAERADNVQMGRASMVDGLGPIAPSLWPNHSPPAGVDP